MGILSAWFTLMLIWLLSHQHNGSFTIPPPPNLAMTALYPPSLLPPTLTNLSQVSLETVPTYVSQVSLGTVPPYEEPDEEVVSNVRQLVQNTPPTSSRPTVTHSYTVRDLTLEFDSYAHAPDAFPILFTNSVINGRIIWDLSREEAPNSISISVWDTVLCIGMILIASILKAEGWIEKNTSLTQLPMTLFGKPPSALNKPFWQCSQRFLDDQYEVTLSRGRHVYEFSFRIPSSHVPPAATVAPVADVEQQQFELPPSFIERGHSYAIQYAVVASISRGHFKLDHLPVSRLFFHSSSTGSYVVCP